MSALINSTSDLPALRLLLDNRHQHIRAQGGQHLHGGDAGPWRLAGHLLHADARHTGLFQDTIQSVFTEQHGVAAVDVPAAIKVSLCAAMDHLTVCKIAVCFAREHFPCFIPIGIDQNASLLAPDIQLWKQPGVAMIGQDQVGIITTQGSAQTDQEGTPGFQGQAVCSFIVANQQFARRVMGRVCIRIETEYSQGQGRRVDLPGRIQGI